MPFHAWPRIRDERRFSPSCRHRRMDHVPMRKGRREQGDLQPDGLDDGLPERADRRDGDDGNAADPLDPERRRLRDAHEGREKWYRWGPYLAERQWGTVREDYSADGT